MIPEKAGEAVGFWVFMLAMALLTPAVMIGLGRYLAKRGPRQINGVFGYRTARSMKNQDTWAFAQRYCGKLWWKLGWVLLAVSAAGMLPAVGKEIAVAAAAGGVLVGAQCVVLLLSIVPVERALDRTFDSYGHRRR